MTFRYPQSPDDPEVPEFHREQFSRVHQSYGAGDPGVLFGESTQTSAPWPRAGREKRRADFDQGVVDEALRNPQLQRIDPRNLHSTQPSITRTGIDYYMGDEYQQTGEVFADKHHAGNKYPVVYDREDGQSLLLSGHHRGAAALLRGEEFEGIRTSGPWGRPRGG